MVAKPIKIAGEFFRTRGAAERRIRGLRDSYDLWESLREEDFRFMSDLLERHDGASIKIGCGVHSIFVMPDEFGGRCFGLTRMDGSSTDFSFRLCLTPLPPHANFRAACRNAIRPQVIDFKTRQFAGGIRSRCALTGELVEWDLLEVDHHPTPFLALLEAFIREHRIDPNIEPTDASNVNSMAKSLARKTTHEAWIAFHRERAQYRLIKSSVHRRLPRGSRPTTAR